MRLAIKCSITSSFLACESSFWASIASPGAGWLAVSHTRHTKFTFCSLLSFRSYQLQPRTCLQMIPSYWTASINFPHGIRWCFNLLITVFIKFVYTCPRFLWSSHCISLFLYNHFTQWHVDPITFSLYLQLREPHVSLGVFLIDNLFYVCLKDLLLPTFGRPGPALKK